MDVGWIIATCVVALAAYRLGHHHGRHIAVELYRDATEKFDLIAVADIDRHIGRGGIGLPKKGTDA